MHYYVPEPATVELHDRLYGRIRASFGAGDHEPDSEQEEVALERLAEQGAAERVYPSLEDPADVLGTLDHNETDEEDA